MPKIKNWTPINNVSTTSGRSDLAWKNENTGKVIVVEDNTPVSYDILLNKNKRVFERRLKRTTNKGDAREWATNWMRDHPME